MSIWTDMGLDGVWVDPVSPKSPSAAAKDLKAKSRVVIAVAAAYPGLRSTKYAGIEVMLWLRLRDKYTGPILLVGFQTAEEILAAHPEHLALLAPGNHYQRHPISETTKKDIEVWLAKPTGLTDKNIAVKYKSYLASAFDLARFRHTVANLYSLSILWEMAPLMSTGNDLAPLPKALSDAIDESLDLHIALALQERSLDRIPGLLAERSAALRKELMDAIDQKNDQVDQLEGGIHARNDVVSDHLRNIQGLEHSIELRSEITACITALDAEKTLDETRLSDLEEGLVQDWGRVETTEVVLNDAKARLEAINKALAISLPSKLRSFPDLRVLHVDDQAEMGWSEFFQRMLYGKVVDEKLFRSLTFDRTAQEGSKAKEQTQLLLDECQGWIRSNKPHCLLLDLRLLPADDERTGMDVKGMTGAFLLENLRKEFRTLPIVLTTASNKIWSHQALLSMGADAYWMKEGLDDQWTDIHSIEHYISLHNVFRALEENLVVTLRKIEHTITDLKAMQPWWSEGEWLDGQPRHDVKPEVTELMTSYMEQIHHHCQRFIYTGQDQVTMNEKRSLSSIAVLGGVVFENLIGSKNEDLSRYRNATEMQLSRAGTNVYSEIMAVRNDACHKNGNVPITRQRINNQAECLTGLVIFPPVGACLPDTVENRRMKSKPRP